MKPFVYPDKDDTVTDTFIHNKAAWDNDEMEVLAFAKTFIHNRKVFIDAGCGFGRLIPQFASDFEKVIAIEPDAHRIENAKTTVTAAGLDEKVDFIQRSVENVAIENTADVVLSSHIIQHISTRLVPRVISKMVQMLVSGGLLILTTNNSSEDHDLFACSSVHNGKSAQAVIQKDEFEDLVLNPSGAIPVHKFSASSLSTLLETNGLIVLESRVFHQGTDVLVIAKKR